MQVLRKKLKKIKMETEKQLDEDLKKAELKKDKALAEKPNVFKQIKIGLDYRADQGLAIGKDKIKKATKKVTSKIKNKIYGVTDLLKTKID
jgi:hypothetical protein|tara:strand:+ start:252 stop:524 length:273 start_codon:yes stop_codon:yes gene_type:complete